MIAVCKMLNGMDKVDVEKLLVRDVKGVRAFKLAFGIPCQKRLVCSSCIRKINWIV